MTLDWSVVWTYRSELLRGAALTVGLAVATMAIAIPGGVVLALMRLSRFRILRGFSTSFIEFFRCTPLILQVYWAFYVLPAEFDLQFSEITTGLLALSMNVSAFNAETFRSGIVSIREGQRRAGLALGMTSWQVMRKIVLPQALWRVLPALATTWVALFKDTSLVSVISVAELSYTSLQIRAQTFRILEVLTAMAALYWLMGYPQAKLTDWIHQRFKVKE